MQRFLTYATDICIRLYLKFILRYEFVTFDTLITIFTWARTSVSVVIFRSQKGSATKQVWETLSEGKDRIVGIERWITRSHSVQNGRSLEEAVGLW
jgi:hypothetical protein